MAKTSNHRLLKDQLCKMAEYNNKQKSQINKRSSLKARALNIIMKHMIDTCTTVHSFLKSWNKKWKRHLHFKNIWIIIQGWISRLHTGCWEAFWLSKWLTAHGTCVFWCKMTWGTKFTKVILLSMAEAVYYFRKKTFWLLNKVLEGR